MGTVVVTIGIGDPQGRRFEDVDAIVDTGSTFTAIPRTTLQRLGVPVQRTVQSELADGSNALVDIGKTMIRLEGLEFSTPVIFAEAGEPILLGVVTLEEALLAVDPVAGRLIPTNALRLWPRERRRAENAVRRPHAIMRRDSYSSGALIG